MPAVEAPRIRSDSLMEEMEVLRRLHLLEGRPHLYAARRVLDRLWRDAQEFRKAAKLAELRRVRSSRAVRYLYTSDAIDALCRALARR